jgi:hypothetical protein
LLTVQILVALAIAGNEIDIKFVGLDEEPLNHVVPLQDVLDGKILVKLPSGAPKLELLDSPPTPKAPAAVACTKKPTNDVVELDLKDLRDKKELPICFKLFGELGSFVYLFLPATKQIAKLSTPTTPDYPIVTTAGVREVSWPLRIVHLPDDKKTIARLPSGASKAYIFLGQSIDSETLTFVDADANPARWELNLPADPDVRAAIEQRLLNGTKPLLMLVDVIDADSGPAGRKVQYKIALDKKPVTQDFDFFAMCNADIDTRQKDELLTEPVYVVCANYTAPESGGQILTYFATPTSKELIGTEIQTNIPFEFIVFFKEGIELAHPEWSFGTVGVSSRLFDGTDSKENQGGALILSAAQVPGLKKFIGRSGPLKPDSGILKIYGKKKDGTTLIELPAATKWYRVLNVYYGALRLGIAAVWTPRARKYEARTASPDSATKYIAVSSGDGSPGGLLEPELVLGYSHFIGPDIVENSDKLGLGFYLGLGIIAQEADGPKVFNSGHVGIELHVGMDWGVVLAFSAQRVQQLKSGFAPNQALPIGEDDVPTQLGFTYGVGLIVNATPSFFDAVGRVPTGSIVR